MTRGPCIARTVCLALCLTLSADEYAHHYASPKPSRSFIPIPTSCWPGGAKSPITNVGNYVWGVRGVCWVATHACRHVHLALVTPHVPGRTHRHASGFPICRLRNASGVHHQMQLNRYRSIELTSLA